MAENIWILSKFSKWIIYAPKSASDSQAIKTSTPSSRLVCAASIPGIIFPAPEKNFSPYYHISRKQLIPSQTYTTPIRITFVPAKQSQYFAEREAVSNSSEGLKILVGELDWVDMTRVMGEDTGGKIAEGSYEDVKVLWGLTCGCSRCIGEIVDGSDLWEMQFTSKKGWVLPSWLVFYHS